MSPTVAQVRAAAIERLASAGVPSPEVDTDLLIGHVLGLSRGAVQAASVIGREIAPDVEVAIGALVARRALREPLQHIVGVAPFRSIELAVGPGVFVPRPESEQVAQFAIDELRASASPSPIAIDLGTGSGAIALALATEVPHATVFGVENSAAAFVWTTRNFRSLAPDNATAVFADLATCLPELDGRVAVVVSNPPYIPDAATPRDAEVRLYDPPAALYGGADGLDIVREVSHAARRLLHSGGTLILEHGELQGADIRSLLTADGWRAAATHPDFLGRDRATTALR